MKSELTAKIVGDEVQFFLPKSREEVMRYKIAPDMAPGDTFNVVGKNKLCFARVEMLPDGSLVLTQPDKIYALFADFYAA